MVHKLIMKARVVAWYMAENADIEKCGCGEPGCNPLADDYLKAANTIRDLCDELEDIWEYNKQLEEYSGTQRGRCI